ncbi:MAG: hypothetical protein J6M48_00185 [Ruminococcus sp.]|nr:hypothetical protein [Ruminococcus sp.]
MTQFFTDIREPNTNKTTRSKVIASLAIAVFGFLLGVFQKWLDGSAVNDLPELFQRLDLTNFFGRIAVWIFIGAAVSVFASTPKRAALNAFLFFAAMLAGYYLYCSLVLGFLPVSYMMIWAALAVVSPLLAYVCWFARGNGLPAVIISALILGALLSQAFLFLQGFRVAHLPEVILWILGLIMLRRAPKEFALEFAISLAAAVLCQLFIPYFG